MIIATASDAADLLIPHFADGEAERVVTAHLDGERRLIETIVSGIGEADGIDLPIRSILQDALRLGSGGIVIAHNHPSGDCRPSAADIGATRVLADTAATLGIVLHDHLIVGRGGDCRSLRALGLL